MRSALVAVAATALVLTGCSQGQPTPAAKPSESASSAKPATEQPAAKPEPAPDEADAEIRIEGDRVEPNGQLLPVSAGEQVVLRITSDRPAELHVHSSPEQVVEVAKGSSTARLTLETPGVVDVEEHESGIVVLQLEVR